MTAMIEAGSQVLYLGRTRTHFAFRLTLQGKPIVAYYPAWLVDRRGPHPIDCTTVALGDERMPPSVPWVRWQEADGTWVTARIR